ncbi:MAG: zeta toxin family protein [Candidatus Paceibacterota bacterium]|jgi:predicted ABC-type ATPase
MNEAEKIKLTAEEFARANRQHIAKGLTNRLIYIPDAIPTSVFMAGSPGAGKTEYSRNLIKILEEKMNHRVIRIDGDELRERMPGYTGNNSFLFQTAISLIVERIHDMVLDNKQTFLLDGTLSKYDKTVTNIKRSLNKGRQVRIFYVYQKPDVAWAFTKAREKIEGRHIPKDAFIQQFIDSRETINRIRKDFDNSIIISLAKKNFETHAVEDLIEIRQDGPNIEDYLGVRYTENDLKKLLC